MTEYIDCMKLIADMEKRYCEPCVANKKDYNGAGCRACGVNDAIGEVDDAHYFKCSNCKYTVPHRKANLFNGKREYNYCPHCGAKMDG